MKKNLIIFVIAALIFTHIIPPDNISFANEEVNECENTNFTVQTIIEDDKKIVGTGFPSDQLTVKFLTKNKTVTVDINSNGKFELQVEEKFLTSNDVLIFSNDFHKVETQVMNEGTTSQAIKSNQYLECPVIEEMDETSERVEEVATEEAADETSEPVEEVVSEEAVDETSEAIEEVVSEEEAPETSEPAEEVASEEEDAVTSEPDEEVDSEETIDETSEAVEGVAPEEKDVEPSEAVEEVASEEEATEPSDAVEEESVTVQAESEVPKSDKDVTESEVRKLEKEEENKESFSQTEEIIVNESINDGESEERTLSNRELKPTETLVKNGITINNVLNVDLFADRKLEIENSRQNEITLVYTGHSILELRLPGKIRSIFYLPPEIMAEINPQTIKGTSEVPSLLGLFPVRETYTQDEIIIDGNYIYMDVVNPVLLNVVSRQYIFTITFEINTLPPSHEEEYVFSSFTNESSINLNLLPLNQRATARMAAPQYPEKPMIDGPVYDTDEVITGSATPNSTIIATIDGKEYSNQVAADGTFSVTIPRQPAGKNIPIIQENSEGHRSEETIVTVIQMLSPPIIDDVYSNETIVTGTGQPNTKIIITIGDEKHEGNVDNNGEFSVIIPQQDPGTIIYAQLTDDFGSESGLTETLVKEGKISFHNVPGNMAFESTEIGLQQGKMKIRRQNPNWALEVNDSRRPGSNISILAEEVKPLTTSDGAHTLPNSLVYIDNNSKSNALNEGAIEVFSGTTKEETIHSFNWEDDKGIFIEVDPLTVIPESYSGTINWTISNGP